MHIGILKQQAMTSLELWCSCSAHNSSLLINFHSRHEIRNMNSSEGASISNITLIYSAPDGERFQHCFTSEQPVKCSFNVHDFIVLPSQLYPPSRPLPLAPGLKIFHLCHFQWLVFVGHQLNMEIKASSCNLSQLLQVLVCENSFCSDQGLKATLKKLPVPIFVHMHLCTLAKFS